MKKILYYFFGITGVVTGIISLVMFFTNQYTTLLGLVIAECCFSVVVFIMLEDRPKYTQAQIRYDKTVKKQGLGILTMLAIATIVIMLASSCSSSRNGYGCHGNQSWGKMVRRINSQ